MRVEVFGADLAESASFHARFAEVMAFPAYYGRNMDAFVDVMGDIAPEGIEIVLRGAGQIYGSDTWGAMLEGIAAANGRREAGGAGLIALMLLE